LGAPPSGLGEQHLDPHVVLAGERQPQQGSVDIAAGQPGGGSDEAACCMSTRQPGRRRVNAAMICWVPSLAGAGHESDPQHPGLAAGGGLGLLRG
jgi:hypothetical protein